MSDDLGVEDFAINLVYILFLNLLDRQVKIFGKIEI